MNAETGVGSSIQRLRQGAIAGYVRAVPVWTGGYGLSLAAITEFVHVGLVCGRFAAFDSNAYTRDRKPAPAQNREHAHTMPCELSRHQ